jgi:hypothetical protein
MENISRWYVQPHDLFKDISLMYKTSGKTISIAYLFLALMQPKLLSTYIPSDSVVRLCRRIQSSGSISCIGYLLATRATVFGKEKIGLQPAPHNFHTLSVSRLLSTCSVSPGPRSCSPAFARPASKPRYYLGRPAARSRQPLEREALVAPTTEHPADAAAAIPSSTLPLCAHVPTLSGFSGTGPRPGRTRFLSRLCHSGALRVPFGRGPSARSSPRDCPSRPCRAAQRTAKPAIRVGPQSARAPPGRGPNRRAGGPTSRSRDARASARLRSRIADSAAALRLGRVAAWTRAVRGAAGWRDAACAPSGPRDTALAARPVRPGSRAHRDATAGPSPLRH